MYRFAMAVLLIAIAMGLSACGGRVATSGQGGSSGAGGQGTYSIQLPF